VTNGCLVCMLTHPGRGVSTSGWYFQFFPWVLRPTQLRGNTSRGGVGVLRTIPFRSPFIVGRKAGVRGQGISLKSFQVSGRLVVPTGTVPLLWAIFNRGRPLRNGMGHVYSVSPEADPPQFTVQAYY